MVRHALEHEIHCTPERMWTLFFDDEFNYEMYLQGLGFPKCEIPEKRDDGEVLFRRMVCTPKVDMPKVVAKIVGDKTAYVEEGEWVRSANEWRWSLQLAAFGDKVSVGGTMRLEPFGDGHCKRITPFQVEAKIFGIAKIIEKTSADNVIAGWNASAAWINGWLARNPA